MSTPKTVEELQARVAVLEKHLMDQLVELDNRSGSFSTGLRYCKFCMIDERDGFPLKHKTKCIAFGIKSV